MKDRDSMARLNHNYHELTGWQRLTYWLWRRRNLSAADRFFFEGHRPLPGQMYRAERKALFSAVLSRQPSLCFEIGTGSGGGSTFFVACAFRQLGAGKLVTLESSESSYREVTRRYSKDLRYLKPHVDFLLGGDPRLFLPYIENAGFGVECVLLDGSDTAEDAVNQYAFFAPHMRQGSMLIAHDWDDVKMSRLRPMIERDPRWHLQVRLRHPESVGFVVYSFAPA